MNYYKELLEHNVLYNPDVRGQIKITEPEWEAMSWRTKEHHFRKHYVCLLLCNTTIAKRPRLARFASTSSSLSSGSSTLDETSEESYRYLNLLTATEPSDICLHMDIPFSETIDIIDKERNKPIHVDLSGRRSAAYKKCIEKKQSIVEIDLIADQITYFEMEPMMPGEEKARSFLATRRSYMLEWGMRIDIVDTEGDLLELCPDNSLLATSTKKWIETFWKLRTMAEPSNISSATCPLEPLNISTMLQMLTDPTASERGEFCKWKGKTLPSCWVKYITTEEEEDLKMCSIFMQEVGYCTGQSDEHLLAKEVYDILQSGSPQSSFKLTKAESYSTQKIPSFCGVGFKTSSREDSNTTTREPEYQKEQNRRLHPWISMLIRDLSCQVPPTDQAAFDPLHDNNDIYGHPMDTISVDAVNKIVNLYKNTHSSITAAVQVNMYSRLGGAYRCREGRKDEHIAIFPLYYRTEEGKRKIQGICLLAPQHNRSPNDKILFTTVELLKNSRRNSAIFSVALNSSIVTTTKNELLYVRRNSTNRDDCEYRTFIHSALFLVANTIGEMSIESTVLSSDENLIQRIEELLVNHAYWFAERLAENIVMGMIGGSQEEGMLAMLRKLFMLMYASCKRRHIIMHDSKEFVDKINECAISSPLALHFLQSFRHTMREMLRLNVGRIPKA